MRLFVRRDLLTDQSTTGCLYIEDRFECFTLEDPVRERPGVPVAEWKIPKQTAIPAGTYRIGLVHSPHFGCMVPLLAGVEGFSAIEIHWGNVPGDTDGCLLIGQQRIRDQILNSRAAWLALMPKLEKAFGVERLKESPEKYPLDYQRVGDPEPVTMTFQNDFFRLPPMNST